MSGRVYEKHKKGVEYEPHPTKRQRSKSCGPACANKLRSRAASARAVPPLLAEAVLRTLV